MKWIRRAFSALGFTFTYLLPIILFGGVVPYTHEGVAAGLTKMGYVAIAVIAVVISGKLKEHLLERPKSLGRALLLSVFPIVWWVIISLALGWIEGFALSLSLWWDKIILFIVLGRICCIIAEALYEKQESGKAETKK